MWLSCNKYASIEDNYITDPLILSQTFALCYRFRFFLELITTYLREICAFAFVVHKFETLEF